MLAPNAEVSLYPWKEPTDRIPLAVRHIRTFLKAHEPAHAEGALRTLLQTRLDPHAFPRCFLFGLSP